MLATALAPLPDTEAGGVCLRTALYEAATVVLNRTGPNRLKLGRSA